MLSGILDQDVGIRPQYLGEVSRHVLRRGDGHCHGVVSGTLNPSDVERAFREGYIGRIDRRLDLVDSFVDALSPHRGQVLHFGYRGTRVRVRGMPVMFSSTPSKSSERSTGTDAHRAP